MWIKSDIPTIVLPPRHLAPSLAGWRDPFIIATPSTSPDGTYKMILGTGIKNKGGLIMVYKSKSLRGGE